jgi:AcrR family transcriptional regulator
MPPSRPESTGSADVERRSAAPGPGLPPAPRLPRRREPPTRRTALTVAGIVEAAIEVLDETGVSGLSMRRVADRLGTGAASLYAHVSGREELLELVFDELVGRVELPEPDSARWREQVHRMVSDFHAVLVSHRDAALAGMGRIPTSPNTLAAAETLSAVMRAGGLSERVVALGLDQLILFVCASAFEQGLVDERGMSPDDLAAYFAEVHAFYDRLPTDRFPTLAAIAPDMTGHDAQARFRFGVSSLLAGYEALSAAESAAD